MDANFLCGLLKQEGIKAVVQGEALQETWGNLNLTTESLPSVWVDEADVRRAEPVVEEYRRVDAANAGRDDNDDLSADQVVSAKSWVCVNCGRTNEPQFDRCWHCTHARQGGTAIA